MSCFQSPFKICGTSFLIDGRIVLIINNSKCKYLLNIYGNHVVITQPKCHLKALGKMSM